MDGIDLDLPSDFMDHMSNDLDDNSDDKKIYKKKLKYKKIIARTVKSFKDIVGNKLSKNTQIRIITEESFNAITVIEFILKKYRIKEITMAIYRLNEKSVMVIEEYIKKNIKINILISSFFNNNKRYEKWAHNLVSFSKKYKNFKINFVWNHAKVTLIKTTCGKYFILEGSGNLSDNAMIEQYIFEDNKIVFDFHREWILRYINKNKE